MANRIFVYPYDQLSESAGKIAEALGTKKIKRKGSAYQPQKGDVIINWGATDFLDWRLKYDPELVAKVLNASVHAAVNKLEFAERTIDSIYVPKYATSKVEAAQRLKFPVVCRTKVKGHDGDGIVIAETADQLVDAKLYTELKHKTHEYRVHVARSVDGLATVLGVQRKLMPEGEIKGDRRIRTTENGCKFVWEFGGQEVKLPRDCYLAIDEMMKYFPEIDFGGFDVIYNEYTNEAHILEINTAPELTPRAVQLFVDYFRSHQEQEPEEHAPELRPEEIDQLYDGAGYDCDTAFDDWIHVVDINQLSIKQIFEKGWQLAEYSRH